jgi:hypothetical protein
MMGGDHMKIYISGKVTGTDDYRQRFKAAEIRLRKWDHKVLNPVAMNSYLPDDTPWETYMRNCISWLCSVEAIYLLKGWRDSKGAKLEKLIAEALGLMILMEEDEKDGE